MLLGNRIGDDFIFSFPPSTRRASRPRSIPVISRDHWHLAIQRALIFFQQSYMIPSRITLSHFTTDGNRYEIKASALPLFKIFPQFHAGGDDLRFRQTLSGCPGPTIEEVIEAANEWEDSPTLRSGF
jgi:hypothetical protein